MSVKLTERIKQVYKEKGLKVLILASIDNIHYRISESICNTNYPVVNVHGSKMRLSFDDNGLSKQLYIHKTREPMTTKVIKEIVKPGMVVLDIGANIGYYALMESKLMDDKGTVYALEPYKKSFDLLVENVELNRYKSITTYQLACSNKNGEEKLFLSEHFNTCCMGFDKGLGYDITKTVTVDSFLEDKKQPDIVRMDVEGHEYYIIEGMKETLKHIKYLVIEWHSSAKKEGWESRIDTILNSGLRSLYLIKKVGYRDEEFVPFEVKKLKDIIKESKWIGIVFKRM